MKALVADQQPALFVDVVERSLATALLYYSVHQPHAGLGGAAPLERHLGLTPPHTVAQPPTRDRPTDPRLLHLTIESLDDEGRFPILVRRAA